MADGSASKYGRRVRSVDGDGSTSLGAADDEEGRGAELDIIGPTERRRGDFDSVPSVRRRFSTGAEES